MAQVYKKTTSVFTCVAAEGQCPLRENCLRSNLYINQMGLKSDINYISVVNLRNPSIHACTEHCEQFLSNEPVRFAKGMSHIYDAIPKRIYREVVRDVQKCFSCLRVYYYCMNGKQLISPDEQNAIAAVFRRYGMGKPVYDGYVKELMYQ